MSITLLTLLLSIGKVMLVSYTISRFEPINLFLELLPDNIFFNFLRLLLTCSKCLSLWTGILLGGIWVGMLSSLLMTIFEKTIGSWIDRVKLN